MTAKAHSEGCVPQYLSASAYESRRLFAHETEFALSLLGDAWGLLLTQPPSRLIPLPGGGSRSFK